MVAADLPVAAMVDLLVVTAVLMDLLAVTAAAAGQGTNKKNLTVTFLGLQIESSISRHFTRMSRRKT